MELGRRIEKLLMQMGANLVGFADVEGISPDNYQRAVAIAMVLPIKVIEEIPIGPTQEYLEVYKKYNQRLDEMSETTADMLVSLGYRSLAQSQKNTPWNREDMITPFPHKTVATRAGLGWIGKCALLVTPQYGSAIRITSVLTNAPIKPAKPINSSRCGSCKKCVDICPGGAILGTVWHAGIPREQMVSTFDCDRAARDMAENTLGFRTTMCGRCFAICPYTQAYLKRSKEK